MGPDRAPREPWLLMPVDTQDAMWFSALMRASGMNELLLIASSPPLIISMNFLLFSYISYDWFNTAGSLVMYTIFAGRRHQYIFFKSPVTAPPMESLRLTLASHQRRLNSSVTATRPASRFNELKMVGGSVAQVCPRASPSGSLFHVSLCCFYLPLVHRFHG